MLKFFSTDNLPEMLLRKFCVFQSCIKIPVIENSLKKKMNAKNATQASWIKPTANFPKVSVFFNAIECVFWLSRRF